MSAHSREPFDAEEARIKRAYDALPHGEPSAALDARILAQARAATSHAPKRRRPWFLGAGLGTAAAAVFAAGIAWQLGVFKGDRNLSTAPVAAPAAQEELDRIDIEFMKQEHKQDEDLARPRVGPVAQPSPAPPPPAVAPRDAASAAGAEAATSGALRDTALPGRAEAQAAEAIERRREAGDKPRQQASAEVLAESQPFPAESAVPQAASAEQVEDAAASRDDLAEGVPAASPPEPAAANSANVTQAPLGAAAAGAAAPALSRRAAGLAKENELPPWAEDMQLVPEAWLERIRDRVQHGDRQGAEHSLRRFVLEHPRRRVPRDLQRLLVE